MRLPSERFDIEAHQDYESGQPIAYTYPAKLSDVIQVLVQDPDDDNGRSDWRWLRLNNGDLALIVFPQGDTYMGLEGTFV